MSKALYNCVKDFYTLTITGTCKNAGKTTVLNNILHSLSDEKVLVAVTSIGRDGESTDVVTGTKKPYIYVKRGTLFATAASLLAFCHVTREIVFTTGIQTPLGQVVLARALSDGLVHLAGASISTQILDVFGVFEKLGAEKIILDGAAARKSIVSPTITQAAILCSGASYHKSIDKTVADTAYTYKLFSLDKCEGVVRCREDFRMLISDGETLINIPRGLEQCFDYSSLKQIDYISVNGAVTDELCNVLLANLGKSLSNTRLVVDDPSKIFVSQQLYARLLNRGLMLQVQNSCKIAAVCINPVSAYGFSYDKNMFLEMMSQAVGCPVFNIFD